MFKYALLAAIAAAADSDTTDAAVATYSGDGVTVVDAESNSMMTTKLGFEITTENDQVANKSTVTAELPSGEWGTEGSAFI